MGGEAAAPGEASPSSPPDSSHRLWYLPRNLPHFDASRTTQCITYRLADSLPRVVAQRLVDERTPDAEARYRQRIERWLDGGHGCCCLRDAAVATDIIETWHRFDGERYRLHAWVVMPNHVHVMITVMPGHPLAQIVQSWKSWTGKRIKAFTGTTGWQRDYWDRFIRDENHFIQVLDYIHQNPVKAGLCQHVHDWRWSSAGRGEPQLASLLTRDEPPITSLPT